TALTRAPQSVTCGSPGVFCSATMSSQARSMVRCGGSFSGSFDESLNGAAPTFGVRAELLGEHRLVLLHEVGGGVDERPPLLAGVAPHQLLDVPVHAHPLGERALAGGAGGALFH